MPPVSASSGTRSTIPAASEDAAHEKPAKSATGRVLVTGSAGLLGREMIRQLADGRMTSRGIDRRPPVGLVPDGREAVARDLLKTEDCRAACSGVQTVVHTAALQYHSGVPKFGVDQFFERNVEMTRNLTDAALTDGVRHFVFVSSDMVYGMPPPRAIRESDPPRPIGPYGRSKLASEEHGDDRLRCDCYPRRNIPAACAPTRAGGGSGKTIGRIAKSILSRLSRLGSQEQRAENVR